MFVRAAGLWFHETFVAYYHGIDYLRSPQPIFMMNSRAQDLLPINTERRRLAKAVALFGLGGLGLAGCSKSADPPAALSSPQAISILTSLGPANAAGGVASESSGDTLKTLFTTITSKMHGFQAGNPSSNVGVIVLFDPQCPHCGRLWGQSKRLWTEVRFAWLPVPLMNKDSLNQGAMILGAKDPVAFMDQHEASIVGGHGGTPLDPALFELGKDKIEANRKLAREVRVDSVPLIYHRKPNGEILATKGGMGAEELVVLIQS